MNNRAPFLVELLNPIVSRLLRVGAPFGPNVLLTVRGRKTGAERTTPIALIEKGGQRWLVSVYGDVNWTRNLRAAGEGVLTTGSRRECIIATELTPEAAARVLEEVTIPLLYSNLVGSFLRPYFKVGPGASAAAFVEEARRHPIFEVRSAGAGEERAA